MNSAFSRALIRRSFLPLRLSRGCSADSLCPGNPHEPASVNGPARKRLPLRDSEKGVKVTGQWISVNERLPDIPVGAAHVDALCWTDAGVMVGRLYEEPMFCVPGIQSRWSLGTVSYWMPFPEAPEIEQRAGPTRPFGHQGSAQDAADPLLASVGYA